jgi:rod shape-determining protein MreC
MNRTSASILAICATLLILFTSLLNPGWHSQTRMKAADILAPAINTIATPIQYLSSLIRNMSGLAELQAQNSNLELENVRLKEWYQTALLLESENKALRDLMNFKTNPQHSYITTTLLSDSGKKFAKSILANAGAKDGVQNGQAVINGDGVVGRIIETGNHTSRILLATDINSRIPVFLANSQQHAILAGQNDKDPTLLHIPNDTSMSIGTQVLTSGLGGVFPYGLIVGQIVADKHGEKRVKLNANMQALMHVRVIKTPQSFNITPSFSN